MIVGLKHISICDCLVRLEREDWIEPVEVWTKRILMHYKDYPECRKRARKETAWMFRK